MYINRQLGPYVLISRLAVGGQSEVFLAIKQGPDDFSRPVVIKALPTKYRHDPKFVQLFYREAFVSGRFAHPNLITVHDAKILRGEHCMVMDFIQGQTVADIAQRGYQAGEPPTVNQAVQIVADACDGLDYAHRFHDLDETSYSIVHRDISPQNLMVTYHGTTMVFDFGIAKILEEDSEEDTLAGGKYAYMSPEQCREEPVDTRSDVFSLGIILYELCTGFRLFRRKTRDEVIEAVTSEPIQRPSELKPDFPQYLENVILKSLERDPKLRYQTAAQMRDDLLQFLAMNSHGKVRHELGDYVASLFEEERAQIAALVQRAVAREVEPRPMGDTPLEKLGRESEPGTSAEFEVPMPEPEDDPELAALLSAEEAAQVEAVADAADGGRAHAELAARAAQAEQAADDLDDQLAAARETVRRMSDEVSRLERRQNLLIALLFVVALIAMGIGILSYVRATSQAAPQPIEIGAQR